MLRRIHDKGFLIVSCLVCCAGFFALMQTIAKDELNFFAKTAHPMLVYGSNRSACSDPQVSRITTGSQGTANGLVLASGQEVEAKLVLSNATPEVTFNR
jgi:hypothetical protein